jgi:hypothetical protein
VLVLVRAGASTASELARLSIVLGRRDGIGLALVELDPAFTVLSDRVGEVEQFWHARRKAIA